MIIFYNLIELVLLFKLVELKRIKHIKQSIHKDKVFNSGETYGDLKIDYKMIVKREKVEEEEDEQELNNLDVDYLTRDYDIQLKMADYPDVENLNKRFTNISLITVDNYGNFNNSNDVYFIGGIKKLNKLEEIILEISLAVGLLFIILIICIFIKKCISKKKLKKKCNMDLNKFAADESDEEIIYDKRQFGKQKKLKIIDACKVVCEEPKMMPICMTAFEIQPKSNKNIVS